MAGSINNNPFLDGKFGSIPGLTPYDGVDRRQAPRLPEIGLEETPLDINLNDADPDAVLTNEETIFNFDALDDLNLDQK